MSETHGLQVKRGISRAEDAALAVRELFGASAGDDVRFGQTHIYHEGRFHQNVALLTLFSTQRRAVQRHVREPNLHRCGHRHGR